MAILRPFMAAGRGKKVNASMARSTDGFDVVPHQRPPLMGDVNHTSPRWTVVLHVFGARTHGYVPFFVLFRFFGLYTWDGAACEGRAAPVSSSKLKSESRPPSGPAATFPPFSVPTEYIFLREKSIPEF